VRAGKNPHRWENGMWVQKRCVQNCGGKTKQGFGVYKTRQRLEESPPTGGEE